MCVAVTLPKSGKTPTLDQLRKMHDANADGAGIAWVERGAVRWLKGLQDAETVALALADIPRPALLHFRWASAGGVRPELTHPFPIRKSADLKLTGTAGRVLIHNGHWHEYLTTCKVVAGIPRGPLSDTRLMAYLAAVRGDKFLRYLGRNGQKLATLAADGTIVRYGQWTEVDGFHCSNTHWRATWHTGAWRYDKQTGTWSIPAKDEPAEDDWYARAFGKYARRQWADDKATAGNREGTFASNGREGISPRLRAAVETLSSRDDSEDYGADRPELVMGADAGRRSRSYPEQSGLEWEDTVSLHRMTEAQLAAAMAEELSA